MKIFLILPFSAKENQKEGVRYCEALYLDQKQGYTIGYFKECEETNPLGFYCKKVNQLYTVGNVQIEKCTYDNNGYKVNDKPYIFN